jgi:hypothetical protein
VPLALRAAKVLVKMRIGGVSNGNINNIIKANIESYKSCQ